MSKLGTESTCAVCAIPASSHCAACGLVAYCSKLHQKSDWKRHKGQCPPFKVSESKELGRFLIAVRDIKPEEIVLQEPALLLCPPRITLPICLGCYAEFEDPEDETPKHQEIPVQRFMKPVLCPKNCGFPLCATCLEASAHEPECTAAWSRGGVKIRNFGNVHPTYEAIGILRILSLKQKDPETYAKFTSLKSHHDLTEKSEELRDPEAEQIQKDRRVDAIRVVTLVQDFFRKSDASKDEVLRLLSIMETNAHEIPIPDVNGQNTRHLIGIYHTSSFLEHNCVPNCVKTWDTKTSNYEIQIRASTAIKRGDHLSISYVDPMWGTEDRRHFLQISKNFECICQRCVDPTELGTNFSSIRCQQAACLMHCDLDRRSTKGLVIPSESNESDWICNNCSEHYPPAYVNSIVEKAGRDLRKLHEKYGNLDAEEEFLKKFSGVLSPNHFYLMEIKLGLAQIYGRSQDEPLPLLPVKKLCRKLQLCDELLNVFDILLPGYNRLRGLILYEKQAAMSTLSKRRRAVEEISVERHREELLVCCKWLLEAVLVLGWEHPNSIEKRRSEGGEAELDELKLLILAAQH